MNLPLCKADDAEQKHSQMQLCCERKLVTHSLHEVLEDGSFSGYASLFNEVDLGKDLVRPGAFRSSLKKRTAKGVRMLFQHDPDCPIGIWDEIREDNRGLFVKGRITEGVAKGQEILSLMRSGAIDGLSIGFKTERSHTNKSTGIRSIVSADLWEISIVTFPMLPQARVMQVKSGGSLPSVREFERWLTRDAGFSRRQAKAVICNGYASIASTQDAAGTSEAALAKKLRNAALTFKTRRIL